MKTGNHILDFMLKDGLPLAVKTYTQLDTLWDASTLAELRPARRVEVEKTNRTQLVAWRRQRACAMSIAFAKTINEV